MVRLDEAAIDRALPLVAIGLEKYLPLQAALATTEVAHDRDFQKRFNAFYRVRRGAAWQNEFDALLQQEKSSPRPYGMVLRALYESTGRVEASFASKLAATVDPNKPVIDAVVLRNVSLRLPPPGAIEARLARVEVVYARLGQMFAEFLASDGGQYLVARFAEAYPGRPVTPVKMLDLVLWQTR